MTDLKTEDGGKIKAHLFYDGEDVGGTVSLFASFESEPVALKRVITKDMDTVTFINIFNNNYSFISLILTCTCALFSKYNAVMKLLQHITD